MKSSQILQLQQYACDMYKMHANRHCFCHYVLDTHWMKLLLYIRSWKSHSLYSFLYATVTYCINLQEYHYWHYCWPREDTATTEYIRLVPCYLVTWIIFTGFVGQICLCMEKLPCQYSIVQANSDYNGVVYALLELTKTTSKMGSYLDRCDIHRPCCKSLAPLYVQHVFWSWWVVPSR